MALSGKNISLPIYYDEDGLSVSFHNLVLRKFTVDSVVMSLGDKITGDVYYPSSDLVCSMQEYVIFNGVKYTLVNPPTLVREGLVSENSDLKGMSKYSFEFYHPMYQLGNLPFTDVAVSYDEMRYKSQDKTFSWIGKPADFVAKLNKNLEGTEWVVVLSENFPEDKLDTLSDVLSFDKNTIADVLKTGYETWGVAFIVDKLNRGEYYHTDANHNNVDYYDEGKSFVVVFGMPSNEIYATTTDANNANPFVFQFGQGVGLKNNSRTPRNNKIVTRIAGYGSENNIPYGYPQIRWYGDADATCTIGDSVGAKQNVTINGTTYEWAMSYPIYEGIVGGEYVKLIKHPFTRKHLMPTVYAESVFNKVSQYKIDPTTGNVVANPDYDPNIEIIDYYDAVEGDTDYAYINKINLVAPSYEIHEFDDIKPELGEAKILGATPINSDLTDADGWDDTMDDDGNYLQSYFKITLPQLDFDIYACAAITEEMQINMRSGACIGCTFTVQVDWDDYKRNFYNSDGEFDPIGHTTDGDGHVRDLTKYPNSANESITVIVQKDINTFGTIMPNIYQHPAANDDFVILGISLPISYVTNAQERLDDAMKAYMLENNVYYYDYPLKFDEYFLARHSTILNQIRPNTVIRFLFNDEQLELYVKQLTMKFNESTLPQYDITLTDNIEVVLNSIGQVASDVEHLSSLISLLRQNYNKNAWAELAKKLSKVNDDTASGLITFAKGWQTLGFSSGSLFGSGAMVDQQGRGEFEDLFVRGTLRASELVFNLIDAEEGEAIRSIGHGEIETVTVTSTTTGTATLKLDGDEWATIDVGDICRGMFNTIGKDYDNADIDTDTPDVNGFQNKKGFFSSYFRVTSVTSSKGSCTFGYTLQTYQGVPCEHPCPLMKFAVYGNIDSNKPERQSCMYISACGIAPRTLFLAGVNSWKIKPEFIKIAQGNINGVKVWEKVTQEEYENAGGTVGVDKKTGVDGDGNTIYLVIKTLVGDAGFYCEDNIYLGGVIDQFKSAAMEAISASVSNLGQASVWVDPDAYVVDCDADGYVIDDHEFTINAKLYFGSELCSITSSQIIGLGYSGSGGIAQNYQSVTQTFNLYSGNEFNSDIITIVLTGTLTENNTTTTYTATRTVMVLASRQGASGANGGGALSIRTDTDALFVDCTEESKVARTQRMTFKASMYVGATLQTNLYSATAVYNSTSGRYNPTITLSSITNGVATWDIVFNDLNTVLPTSGIDITLSLGGMLTISKTISIIPIKQGSSGTMGKAGYSAQLTKASDTLVVDGNGQVIGGLGNSQVGYRLFTEVNIWDTENNRQLTFQNTNGTPSDGKYKLSVSATNCTTSLVLNGDNSGRINIIGITDLTENGCSVDIVATTYDGSVFRFTYSVSISHIEQSYITFDLTNEYDSISYNTQLGNYVGLPVETKIEAYKNTESGNTKIDGSDLSVGYINEVRVSSDLLNDDVVATPTLVYNQNTGALEGISHNTVLSPTLASGLRLRINSNGRVWIARPSVATDADDNKYNFGISCKVVVGGNEFSSPIKRFTITEKTDTTIFRLLLSATAISKEESTYTPSTIDVKASITDDSGTKVYSVDEHDDLVDEDGGYFVNDNIKIRYIDGTYPPTSANGLLTTCPQFQNLSGNVLTVVLVDLSDIDNPQYLDIQSVTINSGGKDGAGQSWVNADYDQIVIDCDDDGSISGSMDRQFTITANLRWGDVNCILVTNQQSMTPEITTEYSNTITEGSLVSVRDTNNRIIGVRKTFTFKHGHKISSGIIRVQLVGTVYGENETHTATKTISVIANKKGADANDGRGIVSVVTYYKASESYSDVVPTSTNDDPLLDGWVDEFIMPTEEEPYLWRFTRTTYTSEPIVEQTDAEMIYVWQDLVNPNLLADTEFKSNNDIDAWYRHGYLVGSADTNKEIATFNVSNKYTSGQQYNQFYGKYKAIDNGGANSGQGSIQFLYQYVYNTDDGLAKVEGNKWYTLSFYIYGKKGDDGLQDTNDFLFSIDLNGLADVANNYLYIDGVQSSNAYKNINLSESNTFVRHTITFKTVESFSSKLSVKFLMFTREYTQEVWLCKPKLEIGKVATDYKPMVSVTEPMARTSTWVVGKQYYQGAAGEPFMDIVESGGRWFRCLRTHVSTNTNAPASGVTTTYWQPSNNFDFVATDLLLADQAVINLMFSQKILMYDKDNGLVASINADGEGSYIIYYKGSGNIEQKLCRGFLIHYNDDATNSEAWRLGHGGDITKSSSDDWRLYPMHKLTTSEIINLNSNSTFDLTNYWMFISGSGGQFSAYDGKIYRAIPSNRNPELGAIIPNGEYTRNYMPYQTIDIDGDVTMATIEKLTIVDGNITNTTEITES